MAIVNQQALKSAPASGGVSATYQIFISVFLLALFGFQALASLRRIHPHRYWPFLYYPMYSRAHYFGDTVPNYRFVGISPAGQEIPISLRDLALTRYQFRYGVARNIRRGDQERLLPYLSAWEKRFGVNLAAVKLVNEPVGLGEKGTFRAPPETKFLPLDPRAR